MDMDGVVFLTIVLIILAITIVIRFIDFFPDFNLNQSKKNIISEKQQSKIGQEHLYVCNPNSNAPDDTIINKFIKNYNKPVKIPYIIGICGASGSGKSFIAKLIVKTIKTLFYNSCCTDIVVISQDSYYKGGNMDTNYDIPEAIDFDLLIKHLVQLTNGESIECPMYDFTTHSRKKETKMIHAGKIIIIEGILIFTQDKLRDLFNMKIFIEAEEPTQIFRRAIRDVNERNRTIEEVKLRYERDVWPSYKEYVLPSSKYADILINNFNDCFVGPQIVLSYIVNILHNICLNN
jgi:uridine kinase